MDADLADLSASLGAAAKARGWRLATAESCTGGWAAQVITHTAGSSDWFERGFITYSNAAKVDLLDVNTVTLTTCGAVSVETASEMAVGALTHSQADAAVAITGVAGPGGGSSGKPVGTVCFAWCVRGTPPEAERKQFAGDREAVRRAAVIHALQGLEARAKSVP